MTMNPVPAPRPGPSEHVVIGAGPVARAVVAALARRGAATAVVTRSGTPVPGATAIAADVRDPAAAAAALAGASVVYQCAQPPYHRWPQEFPALQAGIVDAAAAAGARLVVAENLYGYAPPTGPLTEDLPLDATTRKGRVRAQMWLDLEAAHRAGRLEVVAGRASDFFGPGVSTSAVGDRFVGPIVAGKPVQVLGDPDRLHTYTYAPDFGEALVRLGETPEAWGRAWHVPSPTTTTTRDLAERMAAAAGTTARLRPVAPWQLRLAGAFVPSIREVVEMRYEFDRDWVVSHERYAALCGDHATDLDGAVAATVAEARPAAAAAA